uniref:ATP-dependent transporter ycf16 n=1 Tax=Alexandrium catenella TaxID=2925 RepID=A0A7S1MGY5_ALECA|mmetsp:Transcript_26695/g.72457  ORF Transcript_26695/g.72457 Transcript_26695/m.72457 type:complete len:994 (+) Transcript_26695:3-2984(+)
MSEAPVLLPEIKPDWVDMWPSRREELLPDNVSPDSSNEESRLILQGSFAWTEDGKSVLHEVDFNVKKGEMIAILGKVGSGKSTVLQAILGEMYPDASMKHHLSRPEVIAYASQVPHIGEGTLRDNVLFGQEYDAVRYSEAIAGASLESDLKVLPGGDGVCIGSRGITLSGGQKARVSLARAAYHRGSEVLLIDDPFGAVDAPTAMTLLNRLLLGPLMEGRTRVVVLQPDAERLRLFDRVAILEKGRVVEQGTPEEIMKTIAYQNLLSTAASREFAPSELDADEPKQLAAPGGGKREDNRAMRVKLREEDFEGRPTMDMIKQWCRIGRWRNIINTSMLYGVQVFIWLLADLSLANWTNAIAAKVTVNDNAYIGAYWFWTLLGLALWVIVWKFGMWFTLRISNQILGMMLTKLLRAPVDKFFDKHPIGRIMNRMVADVSTVDFSLFLRSTGTIATIYSTLLPLAYIHFIIPWFITVLAMPVYYLIWQLCKKYWNTTVPLRYCATNSRSDVNSYIADVSTNNTVIRAYGDQERTTRDMCDALDDMIKASLYGERILRRWLVNRILFLWSFYITTTYMVGMLNTKWMGAGTLGLCLANLMLIEALLEPNLDHATGAQLEFIALARIHEYMNIPQEKPREMEGDSKYRSFMLRVERADLGKLKSVGQGASVEVYRDGYQILQAATGGMGFVAASGQACGLQDLCPTSAKLKETEAWHQLIGVNDALRDVDAMASELCNGTGEIVLLEVQSGWLADGARVVVENIKAGYADIPRDVLKGVSVIFEPKMKVSIAGTTGCGKSSLLLVLLRLLEPRAGRVLLNGVDTRDVGLATLRQSLGLVPQDPVLFSGSLKYNLDPFGQYSDGRLWKALALTHMTDIVKGWDAKLNFQVAEEGSNLSFGQRQLICLARMVLRQPALLLLDEATSAIDPRTQEEVQNTIITAFPNSTLVAVAHRLETILDFDYVCVLERGEVIEQGSVKEVSQRKGGRLRKMLEAKRCW